MENEPIQPKKEFSFSTPMAIVIAGALIAGAIIITNMQKGGDISATTDPILKIAQEVGVPKKAFASCIAENKFKSVIEKSEADADTLGARGTPFSVIVTKSGDTITIPGAVPKTYLEKIIDALKNNTALPEGVTKSKLSVSPLSETDHVRGNKDAEFVLFEYSDLDCPFCKQFHTTMKETISKYPEDLAWVYRHMPIDNLHPQARAKAEASECVASISGNDTFWKYIDELMKK
jgi:protein-disulfide isomerase